MHGLDWIQPTLGAMATAPDAALVARHTEARERRLAAESRARSALADDSKRLRQFERLLSQAQRFGRYREEQAAEFTLPWPTMRRALVRLGDALTDLGSIAESGHIFFLTRDEVVAALHGATLRDADPATRRATWERQRHLAPPLMLGVIPPLVAGMLRDFDDGMRGPVVATEGTIVGFPASPGRVRGTVRVVRSPAEFGRIGRGDVLVSPVTTPAWTPVFGAIAAVVTDTGGLGSHSSIVAREYGIPAVVGTGDATGRLVDGELVEVNGSLGTIVRIAPEQAATGR